MKSCEKRSNLCKIFAPDWKPEPLTLRMNLKRSKKRQKRLWLRAKKVRKIVLEKQRRNRMFLLAFLFQARAAKNPKFLSPSGNALLASRWPEFSWSETNTRSGSWSCRRPSDGRRWSERPNRRDWAEAETAGKRIKRESGNCKPN